MPEQIDAPTAYHKALKQIQEAAKAGATELVIYDWPLTTLPPEIGTCTALRILKVSFPTSWDKRSYSLSINEQRRLPKYQGRISQLPAEIGQLTNLTVLDLNGNRLTYLPPEIGQLTNLKSLYLRNNNLEQLPFEIGMLQSLEILDLSENDLTQLPVEIGQLSNLQKLELSGNSLRQVPSEIGDLIELTFLDLTMNNLDQLPKEIGNLDNLNRLYLSQNNLTELPSEICQLISLAELELWENNLNQLPPRINELTNLHTLKMTQNSDLPIPPEILKQSFYKPQLIFDFWQDYLSQQTRPLHEVKMILVGEGSVGKTSLVRRLTADEFDHAEAQTKGINIEAWPVEVSSKLPGTFGSSGKLEHEEPHVVDTHIWDFGGQEIMHATHQFFLTDRSLYLLVLDARQGERESRVEYWLSLIESFAGKSPIIIVLNKCDQHFIELNRKHLYKKYANIAGFVRTSAATGEGLAELKQTIRDTVATMPHVDTLFPLTWFNVKERLEVLAKDLNFLLYDAYKRICQEEDVIEDSKQRTLISFLHDLGIVLNFQDDARVRDTSSLNPEWVTQGVYSLLNQEQLAQQGGVLASNQLVDLLDGALYPPERQNFILSMMAKFELAFPFDGGDRYLIPDLLPVEEPAFPWDDAQSLQFAYHYDVLPYSILHRFMVRQHVRICEKVLWRTGVMLQHDGLQALIKADIEDGVISIAINGEGRRREFLSNLRFTFDSLHQYITGVKPKEMVPIPGHTVEPVEYEFLLMLEKNRVESQFFPGMNAPV